MEKVTVNLGVRSYDILIKEGILNEIGIILKRHILGRKIMVVTDSNVSPLYSKKILDQLKDAGYCAFLETVEAGENSKSLKTAEKLYVSALEHNLDRSSSILALGGGVIGDLAGFIAATYMRGIDFIQVPTTLLAQVDSSVGGKVAVNLGGVKNIVGAFYQPRLVIVDPQTLITLPDRELREGLAEVIKCGIIWDKDFFFWLEKNIDEIVFNMKKLIYVIMKSCKIKAEIVEKDEFEKGIRVLLNFGHTIGHAFESMFGFGSLLHGEAVAYGMIVEAMLAHKIGLLDKKDVMRIKALIDSAVPIKRPGDINKSEFLRYLSYDKKNIGKKITFVLPRKIGNAAAYTDIVVDDILDALDI